MARLGIEYRFPSKRPSHPACRASCAPRPFDSIIGVSGIPGRLPSHSGNLTKKIFSGKPEFLPRNSDHFIRHHWTRHCARFRCDGGRQLFVHRFWRRASDTTRCKVRIVLALTVVAASASSAYAAPPTGGPFRLPLLCTRSGEKISGLTKICYYSCAKSEGAMTATTYEDCPRWTARWQLNKSAQFGPNENPR
jgi:hypothetical protein